MDIVPVREWTQVIEFPDDGGTYDWVQGGTERSVPLLVGPVEVKRFHFEFPAGERPCLIVERKVGVNVVDENGRPPANGAFPPVEEVVR